MSVDHNRPGMTRQAESDRQARLEREAAALRANLRRRKEQAQTRADAGAQTAELDDSKAGRSRS